jgi:hypothetical protein
MNFKKFLTYLISFTSKKFIYAEKISKFILLFGRQKFLNLILLE